MPAVGGKTTHYYNGYQVPISKPPTRVLTSYMFVCLWTKCCKTKLAAVRNNVCFPPTGLCFEHIVYAPGSLHTSTLGEGSLLIRSRGIKKLSNFASFNGWQAPTARVILLRSHTMNECIATVRSDVPLLCDVGYSEKIRPAESFVCSEVKATFEL